MKIFLASILALACAACSGGSQTLPSAAMINARTARATTTGLTFRFKIPRARHRREHYLSAATRSLEVTAFDATHTHQLAQAKINTTPGSAGCTSVKSGTFDCSLKMTLPPGHDTFDVIAYDAANETGKKLSAVVDFAVHVVAGKSDTIALTLGGIPVSLDVAFVGGSVFATGSAVSGLQFGGVGSGATQRLQLTSKDADGYTIVNPGAPVMSLTAVPSSKVTIAAVSGVLGLFNVTPVTETNALPSPNPASAITLTAAATPADTHYSAVKATVSLQNDPIVYMGNQNKTTVEAYAPWSSSPILTLSLPTPSPPDYVAIALDDSGNVYASSWLAGTVSEFPRGRTVASRTITGLSDPAQSFGLAVDKAGDIFVESESTPNSFVFEYTPTGGATPSRTITSSFSDEPSGIGLDASGNLYVAYLGGNDVGVYPPGTSTTPSATITAGAAEPINVAFDSAGNLYVLNYAGSVTEYHPPFTSSSTVAKTFGSYPTLFEPWNLALDGLGNVWVADKGNNNVLEYRPAAPTTPSQTLTTGTFPFDVAVDQLGNVYVPWGGANTGPVSVYTSSASTIRTWTTGAAYPFSVTIWP